MLVAADGRRRDQVRERAGDVVEHRRSEQPGRVAPRPLVVVVEPQLALGGRPVHAGRPVGPAEREAGPPDRSERVGGPHCTSASMIGGACRWVRVGETPTTSLAISRASAMVEAGEKPIYI